MYIIKVLKTYCAGTFDHHIVLVQHTLQVTSSLGRMSNVSRSHYCLLSNGAPPQHLIGTKKASLGLREWVPKSKQ